ncbi:collagen alpha-1(XII) chain-like [Notothenia coriiceps]|uniref:Collagen alpha-1(XII) chain-like n=1 Tax=Notothenia coriiceps TaxID=8208 RepID=A0A6I9N2Y2_9TELE|nr:PREDICTED: collagen alpha-1(XII) chain-like [Notothenia coriiceps]
MAESVSAMDGSDEEEYYDVSDSFPDPCCEEGKSTPAAPQSDHVPLPGEVRVLNSDQKTDSLGFPPTENSAGFRPHLDYSCEKHSGSLTVDDSSPVKVDGLVPDTEYTFSSTRIADNANQSKAASLSVFTVKPLYVPMEPSPPVQITVDKVSRKSLSLHWDTPAGEVESYIVTCCSEGDSVQETTDTNKMTFNNLKPGECYFLLVSTKLRNGRISKPTVTSANTSKSNKIIIARQCQIC